METTPQRGQPGCDGRLDGRRLGPASGRVGEQALQGDSGGRVGVDAGKVVGSGGSRAGSRGSGARGSGSGGAPGANRRAHGDRVVVEPIFIVAFVDQQTKTEVAQAGKLDENLLSNRVEGEASLELRDLGCPAAILARAQPIARVHRRSFRFSESGTRRS